MSSDLWPFVTEKDCTHSETSVEDLCPPSSTASLIECLIDAGDDPESSRLEKEENQLRRLPLDRYVPPVGLRGKLAIAPGFPLRVSSRSSLRPSSGTTDILDLPTGSVPSRSRLIH